MDCYSTLCHWIIVVSIIKKAILVFVIIIIVVIIIFNLKRAHRPIVARTADDFRDVLASPVDDGYNSCLKLGGTTVITGTPNENEAYVGEGKPTTINKLAK
jgi:hypothetical protein